MSEPLKTSLRSVYSVPSLFFSWWKGVESNGYLLLKCNPSLKTPIPISIQSYQ